MRHALAAQLAQHVGRAPASPCGAGPRPARRAAAATGSAAQRAGDLHQALRAERQVAGQLVHLLGHADALQLALGLAAAGGAPRRGRAAASPPARRACRAGARRARRSPAPSCRGSSSRAGRCATTPSRAICARAAGRRCAGRESVTSPRVSGSTPVTRLKVVDLPAPFGPIRPTISPARTSKLTSLTATRPPNSLRTACTSSTTSPARGRGALGQRRRVGPVDLARARRGSARVDERPRRRRARTAAPAPAATPKTMIS